MKNIRQVLVFVCNSNKREREFVNSAIQISNSRYRKKAIRLHRKLCDLGCLDNGVSLKTQNFRFLSSDDRTKCSALIRKSYLALKATQGFYTNPEDKSEYQRQFLSLSIRQMQYEQKYSETLLSTLYREHSKVISGMPIYEAIQNLELNQQEGNDYLSRVESSLKKLEREVSIGELLSYDEAFKLRYSIFNLDLSAIIDTFNDSKVKKSRSFKVLSELVKSGVFPSSKHLNKKCIVYGGIFHLLSVSEIQTIFWYYQLLNNGTIDSDKLLIYVNDESLSVSQLPLVYSVFSEDMYCITKLGKAHFNFWIKKENALKISIASQVLFNVVSAFLEPFSSFLAGKASRLGKWYFIEITLEIVVLLNKGVEELAESKIEVFRKALDRVEMDIALRNLHKQVQRRLHQMVMGSINKMNLIQSIEELFTNHHKYQIHERLVKFILSYVMK